MLQLLILVLLVVVGTSLLEVAFVAFIVVVVSVASVPVCLLRSACTALGLALWPRVLRLTLRLRTTLRLLEGTT